MEFSIKDILARHPMPGLREAGIRQMVAEAVTAVTGVPITPSQVTHTDGRLVLSVPPVLKSAILLNLDALKNRLNRDGIQVMELR
ncbi:MAG TPA: hypothetical protein VGB97_03970 [Candidatus Paceibacterota bacterium]|jgi:hypothetical protein